MKIATRTLVRPGQWINPPIHMSLPLNNNSLAYLPPLSQSNWKFSEGDGIRTEGRFYTNTNRISYHIEQSAYGGQHSLAQRTSVNDYDHSPKKVITKFKYEKGLIEPRSFFC